MTAGLWTEKLPAHKWRSQSIVSLIPPVTKAVKATWRADSHGFWKSGDRGLSALARSMLRRAALIAPNLVSTRDLMNQRRQSDESCEIARRIHRRADR